MKMHHIACAAWATTTAILASAQTPPQPPAPIATPAPSTAPLSCPGITDNAARLTCYDQWAQQLGNLPSVANTPAANTSTPTLTTVVATETSPAPTIALTTAGRAVVQPSEITRFWDLEKSSAKEKFQLRAYRPISLSVATANQVNTLPSSPTNGSPANAVAYNATELKINLSVRTKLVTGLLHRDDQPLSDSLWFGYSQQSYWQLFNSSLSRPFRATDHEPELIYVFGHNRPLPGGWTYRMSGAGLVHQSNGQSLPLSRSWNRVYIMAAADHITAQGNRFTLQAKAWQRLPESNAKDDNPDISNSVGRAELAGTWSFDTSSQKNTTTHTLGMTLRHSLKSADRGSVRLDYLRSLGNANSSLRFHTQLFSGYGDSLVDYNRRRTVLSLGLSLVDW
jgi:phospholipase A1/A2